MMSNIVWWCSTTPEIDMNDCRPIYSNMHYKKIRIIFSWDYWKNQFFNL